MRVPKYQESATSQSHSLNSPCGRPLAAYTRGFLNSLRATLQCLSPQMWKLGNHTCLQGTCLAMAASVPSSFHVMIHHPNAATSTPLGAADGLQPALSRLRIRIPFPPLLGSFTSQSLTVRAFSIVSACRAPYSPNPTSI